MVEDKLLIWKLRRGSTKALERIYEKYKADLLRLSHGLLNDKANCEDVVHDVFMSLVKSAGSFRLEGSLKGFLVTCVVNRTRNLNNAARVREAQDISDVDIADLSNSDRWLILDDEFNKLAGILSQLPYQQREVVLLHLQGGMKFHEIARMQNETINTVQSRYRYGLQKLRTILNGELEK